LSSVYIELGIQGHRRQDL